MRHYVPQLEDHFLMVYWDQRGAGRSYHRRLARDSMTIERMEQDLDELVDRVRSEFGQERVVLLGHSWGTILGTRYAHEHPRRVAAYVGVGQVASFSEGERVSLAWAMEQAEAAGDEEAAAALGGMAPRPANVSEELELGRWVQRYGGYLREGLTTAKLIRAALATDEVNLVDLWKFGAGNRFSLNALRAEYSREDLTRLRSFEVPVVFLLGRHDWHVPSVLAAEYFQRIDAPCKRLVWFEQSGHDAPFEEPDAFVRVLVKVVLPLAVRGCPAAAGTGGPPPRPGRVVRLAATPAGR